MGRISEENYANVGSTYTPNTSDLFVLETTNGTRTISSDKVVNPYSKTELDASFKNPYSKTELDNKFSGTEKFSVLEYAAELSTANDPQTVYRGPVAKPGAIQSMSTVFVSTITNKEAQLGIIPDGSIVVRTRTKLQNNTWGSWSNWGPIGTTDNIENSAITNDKLAFEAVDTDEMVDGAVTLPKLGSDVMETGVVNTYIVEGGEGSAYTALGEYVLIGGKCILSVEAKCTRSEVLNQFALPVPASRKSCMVTTDYWPSVAINPKMFYIKADGSECYIKASDGSALNRASIYFTIIYSYDPNA